MYAANRETLRSLTCRAIALAKADQLSSLILPLGGLSFCVILQPTIFIFPSRNQPQPAASALILGGLLWTTRREPN